MAPHPLRNVVIGIMGPDSSVQVVANLTVADPGAKRLADIIGGISHMTDPEMVKQALRLGFAQIDQVSVNAPTPPVPAGETRRLTQVYDDDLIDIALGGKIVLLYGGEIPVIVTSTEAAEIQLGDKHLYRDLETGVISVKEGDGKAEDAPLSSTEGQPAGTSLSPASSDDGSAAGEKHVGDAQGSNPPGT